jgi:hypothetical protein
MTIMDEQIKKVKEVTEYTETTPAPVDPATGLPAANPITLPEVEAANRKAEAEHQAAEHSENVGDPE